MTDLHLIALLKKHGWKLHTRSTLRNWTKERLIDEIECIENNWGVSLEYEEISFGYKKKLFEENDQLKQQIEKMKCCANCKHALQGEYDAFEDCRCCHAADVECSIKSLTKNSSGEYHDYDDKCDKWELAE